MKITHRPYRGEKDNQAIRNLLSQNYAVTQHPYYTVDPPNWERISAADKLGTNQQTIHLWELTESGQSKLIGIVLYLPHQATFSSLTHPHHQEIEALMVDWVESEHSATETEGKKPLKCSVCARNQHQKAILAQRGYVLGQLGNVFRKRHLDGLVPEAILLQGYVINEVQNLSTAQFKERTAVEANIFGGTITTAFLQALQQAPIYRPSLDLVITSPSECITAFCTIWFDKQHHVGYFEPIGTVSTYRRSGLGKALMVEGFRRLQKMGATTVYLGHGANNQAGNQLYESVGMSVFDQEYWWQKEF